MREATDQHGRKLGYKNLPHGVSDLTLHGDEALSLPGGDVFGRDFSRDAVRGPPPKTEDFGRPLLPVAPPRVAFTRRVIHLNFDVAPSAGPSCRNY